MTLKTNAVLTPLGTLFCHTVLLTNAHQFSAVGGSGAIPLIGSLFKPGAVLHNKIVSGFIVDKA